MKEKEEEEEEGRAKTRPGLGLVFATQLTRAELGTQSEGTVSQTHRPARGSNNCATHILPSLSHSFSSTHSSFLFFLLSLFSVYVYICVCLCVQNDQMGQWYFILDSRDEWHFLSLRHSPSASVILSFTQAKSPSLTHVFFTTTFCLFNSYLYLVSPKVYSQSWTYWL